MNGCHSKSSRSDSYLTKNKAGGLAKRHQYWLLTPSLQQAEALSSLLWSHLWDWLWSQYSARLQGQIVFLSLQLCPLLWNQSLTASNYGLSFTQPGSKAIVFPSEFCTVPTRGLRVAYWVQLLICHLGEASLPFTFISSQVFLQCYLWQASKWSRVLCSLTKTQ